MSYWPEVGGAWGCQVNAHRHAWNGAICQDPCNWDCGAKTSFRENYCDRGDDSCYQLYMFDAAAPWFIVDEKGLKWVMDEDRKALDDQVLIMFCHEHREPGGAIGNGQYVVAGIYVIDHVDEVNIGHKSIFKIVPKKDCAIQLADLRLPPEHYESLGRPYMRHFDATAVKRMKDRLALAVQRQKGAPNSRRVEFLERKLDSYLARAATRNEGRRERDAKKFVDESGSFDSPFARLKDLNIETKPTPPAALARPVEVKAVVEPAPQAEESVPGRDPLEPLFELATARRLEGIVGADAAHALWLAGRPPNGIILLRGAPGIGKSRVAIEATANNQRTVIAVPSTWRGREDLLGYTSPVTGEFHETPFTSFLRRAEQAWNGGDRQAWVVLFEEFNLSPPEYWLSDILVRAQYAEDAVDGRTIDLGGTPPESWGQAGTARVWLSPAVRFIGTINSDHTTRDLSPRVLDRVTLVQVELQPDAMFERLDLALEDGQRQAVKDLHQRLERRGAVFSMRTALSIKAGLEDAALLDIDSWNVLDIVLVTRMLSKVRLYVGEPGDHELVTDLAESWAEEWGAKLPRCVSQFERWKELLDSGFDVVQA